MSVIKYFNGKNQQLSGLKAALDYVMDYDSTKGYVAGRGVLLGRAFECMVLTKQLYRKTGGRQKIHFVVSFTHEECSSAEEACEIVSLILDEFAGEYQIVVGTHVNTEYVHCHFLLNSVSYKTGKKFQSSPEDLVQFKKRVREILGDVEIYEMDECQEMEEWCELHINNESDREKQSPGIKPIYFENEPEDIPEEEPSDSFIKEEPLFMEDAEDMYFPEGERKKSDVDKPIESEMKHTDSSGDENDGCKSKKPFVVKPVCFDNENKEMSYKLKKPFLIKPFYFVKDEEENKGEYKS